MLIPIASSRRAAPICLGLMLFSASALCAGQEGGAFGLSAQGLASIFAGQDRGPLLALDETALDDTGAYGPEAYYYSARWLDSRDKASPPAPEAAARAILLYRRAFNRAEGLVKSEAGLSLISRLGSAGLWEELLAFAHEYALAIGPEWRTERPCLDALDALGRFSEIPALAARLGSAYPAEASREADALAYYSAAADLHLGGKTWTRAFRSLLLERPLSEWTERGTSLVDAEPRLRAVFSPEELHALAMRVAVRRKNYGPAYKEAILASGAAMGKTASTPMIADAGKAFLYGGALKEGEARFTAQGWTARYYRARFARSLGRWDEAAQLFRKAAAGAPTRADADSARWYAAECSYRAALEAAKALQPSPKAQAAAETGARSMALEELVADSALWLGSETYADLVNVLFRDALAARDWRLIEAMAQRLAPALQADLSARISYTAARAFELGLGSGPQEIPDSDPASRRAAATVRFAAISDNPRSPLHYKALAAWRAGIEPSFVQADSSIPETAQGKPEFIGQTETFIAGFASIGLGDLGMAEARARRKALGDEALRRLAALFDSLSRPDCALRLVLELSSRPGYQARRSDYELLYPRPYLELIRGQKYEPRLREGLALGLLRSESLFNAQALSWAGAAGLSQLMPSTAAEQAKALGLANYDLMAPGDNLTIGLAHFASLLKRTEGRPLRAMMAYNAGWGRLRKWTAESGELPDDLMIEALGIEETRQYCRNILQATVMYGELYYGRSVGETVAEIVEGSPVWEE